MLHASCAYDRVLAEKPTCEIVIKVSNCGDREINYPVAFVVVRSKPLRHHHLDWHRSSVAHSAICHKRQSLLGIPYSWQTNGAQHVPINARLPICAVPFHAQDGRIYIYCRTYISCRTGTMATDHLFYERKMNVLSFMWNEGM